MSTFQKLIGLVGSVTPTLKKSAFVDFGMLTPEEFVEAGDFLVNKCPTWSWASGAESNRKSYLPPDKQFLITKNVPCRQRVKELENIREDQVVTHHDASGEEIWIMAQEGLSDDQIVDENIEEIQIVEPDMNNDEDLDDEFIPDIEDVNENDEEDDSGLNEMIEEEDPGTLNGNILRTRTYDLSISYDNYYRTPRIWFMGYNENKKYLNNKEIYQDISQDHVNKTVTIEPHPHLKISQASIHPCKHAIIMKKMIDHLVSNGKEIKVHQYMILFLKFIASVIPTIEYDYTMALD
jgi:ubiquitin-like-conjugating enzyme ATG3